MSLHLEQQQNQEQNHVPLRRYDSASDRLFLVYYPIIPGYNRNKWGVTEQSIERNIQSAINKPVVIYRKNPDNPIHTKQAGFFVHPTPQEAATELGHSPNAEEYYKWQEKFAVGRVRSVEKRDNKGYAFTLEITDPEAKNILKSDSYREGIPGWTSPQIISNGHLYPEEERTETYDHWIISHIALLDVPAYGFDQAGARAKCFGAEKECMIQTRSASQENLGFCIKQAAIDLVTAFSNSSQSAQEPQLSHTIMSQSENTASKSSETVTYTAPNDNTNNPQASQSTESPKEQQPQQQTLPTSVQQQEPQQQEKPIEGAKTLEEANIQIRQMSELLAETNKQLKAQQKELDRISLSEKKARLAFVIPRDLFKSDESHMKEVEKAMTEKVSESFLIDYWNTKRQLAMMQSNAKRTEEPIAAKSASLQQHDVPDFSSSQNQNQRSNIQKQLDLQKMILEGGTT